MTRSKRSSLGRVILAILMVGSMAACGGDDSGSKESDATPEVDEVEVIERPAERHWLEATLDPPGIGALPGWVLMNRYGQWVTDDRGEVGFEVSRSGLTLTLVLPPGPTGEDPRATNALVIATSYLDEETPPTEVALSVRDGAVGLLMLDPRFLSQDAWMVKATLERAYGEPAVQRLAEAIDRRFDTRGLRVLLNEADVVAALDLAADTVAAQVGWVRWPGVPRGPRDEGRDGAVVARVANAANAANAANPVGGASGGSGASGLVEVVADGGQVLVKRLPGVVGVVRLEVRTLDLERGELVSVAGLAEPVAVEADEVSVVSLSGESVVLEVGADTVVEVRVSLDEGAAGESELGREMALRAFVADGRCGELPAGFAAALMAEGACRTPSTEELAAGVRLTSIAGVVGGRVLERRKVEVDLDFVGLDPKTSWTGFRRGDGAVTGETVRVAVGSPFRARPVVDVGDGLVVGGRVGVSGALVGRADTRLSLRDSSGRRAEVVRVDGGFVVPDGLAGVVTLAVETPGDWAEVQLGTLTVVVDEVVPAMLDRARRVRFIGHGFYPGAQIEVGGQVVVLGEAVGERQVEVELDPAVVGVGVFTVGGATLVVPAELVVAEAPSVMAKAGRLVVTLGGLAVDSPLTVEADGVELDVLMVTRDDSVSPARAVVMVETEGLEVGTHEVVFAAGERSVSHAVEVVGAATLWERVIELQATGADLSRMLGEAVQMASGEREVPGRFQRVNMGFQIGGSWYCPLDISPDEVAIAPASCGAVYERCDEGWLYDDQRNATTWWKVTRPPGRGSTGVRCPVIPGPDSWVGVPKGDIADTVVTTSAAGLAGLRLRGPNTKLVLPNARGGGLVVSAPVGGGRSDVTLDLVVTDATATIDEPVVRIDGATGVHIERLVIEGRPGACAIGLRVERSADVRIDVLEVRGCTRGVEVVNSEHVRVGRLEGPAVALGATEGFQVVDSAFVVAHVRAGTRVDAANVGAVLRVPSGRGIVVRGSSHVRVTGSGAALVSESVVVRESSGVRVGPFESGLARAANGVGVVAEMNNSMGLRIDGESHDVRLREVTAVAAGFGIDVYDSAEVHLEKVAVGGVDDGYGAGPLTEQALGNFGGGLRVFNGDVTVDGLVASTNGIFGVGVFGGRAWLSDVRTQSRAGSRVFEGGQPCAIQVGGGEVVVDRAIVNGDEDGVCVGGVRVRVADSQVSVSGTGVEVVDGAVEIVGSELSGAVGVAAARSDVWLDGSSVTGDGEGVVVSSGSLVAAGSAVTADGTGVSLGGQGRSWLSDMVMSGVVGLEVVGGEASGPVVDVVGGTVTGDEEQGITVDGRAELRLGGVQWAVLSSDDGVIRVRDDGVSEGAFAILLAGRAELDAEVGDRRTVNVDAFEHEGGIRVVGGRFRGSIDGSRIVILEDQADLGSGFSRVGEVRVTRSSWVAGSRFDGVGRVLLNEVNGGSGGEIIGGSGHQLSRVRTHWGVRLSGFATATMNETWSIAEAPGMPMGRVVEREFVWTPTGATPRVVWVEEVPDRSRVVLGRRGESTIIILDWADSMEGRARFVTTEVGDLVAQVTGPDGASGPWMAIKPEATCVAGEAPAEDRDAAGELRWETDAGWEGNEGPVEVGGEVAHCGERVAVIETVDAGGMRLTIDGQELVASSAISNVAWSRACDQVTWVGGDAALDVMLGDVESGVVTRLTQLTDDTAIESAPAFSADGEVVWFGRASVSGGELMTVDVVSGEVAVALTHGSSELREPAPSPDGSGVVFLVCEAECRLAKVSHAAWSYLDTAAPGADGFCEASDPRWVEVAGAPLLVYVRGDDEAGRQVVTASGSGVVRGALANGVTRLR